MTLQLLDADVDGSESPRSCRSDQGRAPAEDNQHSSSLSTPMAGHDACTRIEAFEYQDLADIAETVKNAFDDLTGVSPLWFSVEKDEDAGAASHSLRSERGGGGCEMFGDWRVEESLVDAFEDQAQAGSDKQEIMKVVHALLATYDENGVKQRQGLEECVLAFETAIEGDLNTQLDTQAEQCTRRWNEDKENVDAAVAGLAELETCTVARLEGLGQVLKDRQSTVLAALKHEREANTRKILASTLSDPLEEGRLLFERQVEETQLEGRLKQRRRLLDLSLQGVQVRQEEIEGALLKAARDEIQNLMQVVDKMQNQQTKLLVTLQAEKKKVSTMRQHVSSRLGAVPEKVTGATTTTAEGETVLSHGKKGKTVKVAALAVEAAATIWKGNAREGLDGDDHDIGLDGELEQLSGVDLLDACDRLENDNLGLRQRLAKLELQTMQKEHGGDDDDDEGPNEDPQLASVLEAKRELQRQLEGLHKANEERSNQLERARRDTAGPPAATTTIEAATNVTPETVKADAASSATAVDEFKADIKAETKTLTQKVKTLRRKLVFKLACKVMRRRFQEAGLGAGNDPDPPLGPVAVGEFQARGADGHGLPQEMQLHAALIQQKLAVEREIRQASRAEDELQRAIEEAEGINSSGATTGRIVVGVNNTDLDDDASTGRGGGDRDDIKGRHGSGHDGSSGGQSGLADEEEEGGGAGGAPKPRRSSVAKGGGRGGGVAGKSSLQTKSSEYVSAGRGNSRSRALERMKVVVQRRLSALRAVSKKNEEVAQANMVDAADNEAVLAVLRNEAFAKEKALAVLSILGSRAMDKARTRWLRDTLERSMEVQTKTCSENAPLATSVAPATTGPMPADIAMSAVGKEEGAQISDSAIPSEEEKPKAEKGTQGEPAVVSAPAPGGGEEVPKAEPLEKPVQTVEAEMVVPTAQEVPAAAEPEASAMSHGTTEDGAQAREREECEQLVKMRAEKILLVKDLREKVKAAGGGKPRSVSQDLKKREILRALKKAKEAEAMEKKRKIASTDRKNEAIFKTLPPKTKRIISNLRKQEVSLIARCELCVERIKKLLLNKGFSPTVAPVADHSVDHNQPAKPRKWTASERRREAFLHSLTPQLERWRARIVAATVVLEEEQARRDRGEADQEVEAADGRSKDSSPSPEAASPPERTSELVASDERRDEQRGTPSQAPAPNVSRAANHYVDSQRFADDPDPSKATAAPAGAAAGAAAGAHSDYQSARGHSPGSADKRGGSGGGDGRTRRPRSAENAGTLGKGITRFGANGVFWQKAYFPERAKEASRRQISNVAAAPFHGNKIYLTTDHAPGEMILTPRPPAGSPSSPSPRPSSVPPAIRYTLEQWRPQRSVPSEHGGSQDHSQGPHQTHSPALNSHARQTTMGSHQAAATTTHSNVNADGVDTSFGVPTGTGRCGLHNHHSAPLLPQLPLVSPRLSPRHQRQNQQQQLQQHQHQQHQQHQRQVEVDVGIDGDTIPPWRGSPQRPCPGGTGSLSKAFYDPEQQRRQLLQKLLSQPARPTAGRAATAGHGGVDHAPSFGGGVHDGVVTSPPSVSPSRPVKVPIALDSSLLVRGESVELVSSSPRGASPSPPLQQQSLLRHTTGDANDIVVVPTAGQLVGYTIQEVSRENVAQPGKSGGGGVSGEPVPNPYTETGSVSSSAVSVALQQEERRPLTERDVSLTAYQDQRQQPSPRRRMSSAWFACPQNGDQSSSSANFYFNKKRPSGKRPPMKEVCSPNAGSSPRRHLVAQERLGTIRGTKISAPSTTTAAVAAATASNNSKNSNNNNTTPNPGALDSLPSSMTSVTTPCPNERRRCYSEKAKGSDRRSLTDKSSTPSPMAIYEAPPQPRTNKRETIAFAPGSWSYRDNQQVKQQKQHHSWSSRNRAGNDGNQGDQNSRHHSSADDARLSGAGPTVSTTVSALPQSMLPATEWMDLEWNPLTLPRGSTRTTTAVDVVSGRSMSTTTGMRPTQAPPVFSDDKSTPLRMVGAKLLGDSTVAAGCAVPSSPQTEPRQGEFVNDRMWGRGGVVVGGGRGANGGGNSSPTPAVSPRDRHTKKSENLLVPLLTESRSTPRREVREREEGVASGLQRDGDDSARNAAAGPAPAKQEDSDGWESSGRRYFGSPPPSPTAWTPATGKRPLFSGGEV